MVETVHHSSLSSELRQLEAEYERTKFEVHRDTLLAQKSLLEVDLFCIREELWDERQRNAKLEARVTELTLRTKSPQEEAADVRQLRKCAERTLKRKAAQVAWGLEARSSPGRGEPRPSELSTSLGLSSKLQEKPSGSCCAEDQQDKALPGARKSRQERAGRRHMRQKVQRTETRQSSQTLQQSGSEVASDVGLMQRKGKVVQDQKHPGEEKALTQNLRIPQQGGGQSSTGMSKEQREERDFTTANTPQNGDRTNPVKTRGRDSPGKRKSSFVTGVYTTSAQEHNIKEVGKSLCEQQPKKPGDLATDKGERGAKETVIRDEGAKRPELEEFEYEVGNEVLGPVENEVERDRDKVRHVEEIEHTKTDPGKVPRQRRHSEGNTISDQMKKQEEPAQENEGSDKNEESTLKAETKEDKGEVDGYRSQTGKPTVTNAQSRSLRVKSREVSENSEHKNGAKKKEVSIECLQGMFGKATRKSQRQLKQQQVQGKELEQGEKQAYETNTSRKRSAIREAFTSNIKKSRSEQQTPRQHVPSGLDDTKSVGKARLLGNPSARPETGKPGNGAELTSCGDGRISSLTGKSCETAPTTIRSKEFSPQSTHCARSSHHLLSNSTPQEDETINPEVEKTGASVKQSTHGNCRKQIPVPLGKRGKENASTKWKTRCQVPVVRIPSCSDMPSFANSSNKRKGLFNARDNSLEVSLARSKESLVNTAQSSARGMPLRLNEFMKSFIAPKLLKSKSHQ